VTVLQLPILHPVVERAPKVVETRTRASVASFFLG
jgi:hypothetical protein